MKLDPVLIVDDEKDNLEALQRLLRNLYDITTTTSPVEALALVRKNSFHVIISDQRMPEMSGVELLEKVKAVSPVTTRILLTGYTDIDSVIGAINRGNIYRYIAKPWDPEDLRQTIKQANDSYLLRVELEEKNRELSGTNAELVKALEALTVLDRAKARFLSLVSHELNTPLTTLSAFTELLEQNKKDLSPDIQKAVGSLSNASSRLSEIISEVLLYVRLETENQLNLQDFDWQKEMLDALTRLEGLRQKRQVGIRIEGTGKPVTRCDPEKMRIAVYKLFEDAVVRSPEKKEVKIHFESEPGAFILRIEGEGIALSENAFAPLETSGNVFHHQKDLGLGLAIAKRIIEQHRGTLGFADEIKRQSVRIRLAT